MAKAEKLNINQSSREDLMQVEGVSSTTADLIYRFLQENAPLENLDGLRRIKGINDAMMEKIERKFTAEK